ncbi:hypothetical protein [Streptomyces sp. A5-4]|uniref:hypothetical protein n=1 Tax=Streptomyces sp. A5-4 TaxID=3384771 RepID=UPI003DAA1448
MDDDSRLPVRALPDGTAELRLVVRLDWQDVAALGQEAARLAAQDQRPVTLDEAAGRRLRTRASVPARSASEQSSAVGGPSVTAGAGSSVSAISGRSPSEQARHAIEKLNEPLGDSGPGKAPMPPASAPATPVSPVAVSSLDGRTSQAAAAAGR